VVLLLSSRYNLLIAKGYFGMFFWTFKRGVMDKNTAIEFQNVGKQYRLCRVGTGTPSHDLNRWWQTTILRKEDHYLKI